MPRRYFNWKLAIVLVVGLAVLCVTAFGLRQWQKSNRAERGLVLGNKAYEERRYEDAARHLGRYIGVHQDDVPALLKYADAQLKITPLKQNNVRQAIATYHIVLRADQANSEAATRLIELYLSMRMPGEAELIAKKCLDTTQNPEVRILLATAMARQRKLNEAAAELKSIITEDPNQVLAYQALGQLTEQFPGDFAEPAEPPEHWYNEAVKNNPSTALAYLARAAFYLRAKNDPNALVDLDKAATLDLSESAVRLGLAKGFIAAGALDKAEEQLKAVQEVEPTNQSLWQTWAGLALKSQSQEKMAEVAERGLESLAYQPWDFMLVATELFIRGGELDRATDCIAKLDQKDIDPAMVAFLRGLVASEKGDQHDAVKYWQQSRELGNKSLQVQLAVASALSALGDTQSALRQLRMFVFERPDSFEGHLTLAKLLAKSGDWTGAAEYADRARQLSRKSIEAALLYWQARAQLLAARPAEENAPMWEEIDRQLVLLEDTADDVLQVRLLRLQVALQRGKFAEAQGLLAQLKEEYPSHFRIAMAEVGLLVAQEKEDEVIPMLNKTIEDFPEAVEPVTFLALLLDEPDNHEECEAVIKEALARIEGPPARYDLTMLLVQFYGQWGQVDNAYRLLNALSQQKPNNIPIKRRLLSSEPVIKDPERAQQLVDEIKALEGEGGWQWRYEQARVWYNGGDFNSRCPQIIPLLQENLLANQDDQASRRLLAATYERSDRLQMALSAYREALSRSPQDIRLIAGTVGALYKAQEYEEAEEILNRVSKEGLSDPALQQLQYEGYLRRGQLGSATDILQDYLGTDPNNISAGLSLALLKMQQNDFDEARKLLDDLRAQEPNSLPIMFAQIQLNVRADKPDEALKLCDQIIGNLNNASAYVIRARTHVALGQAEKAIEDFNRAVTIDPNGAGVWVARSDFYSATGQSEKAMTDIEQALSLDPNNIQIQRRVIALFLASGRPDKAQQARAILDQALKSNPANSMLKLLKAQALLAEGTAPAIDGAVQILRRLTEDQPRISGAWALLGEILLRQGLPGEAIDTVLQGLVYNTKDRTLLILKARAEAARSPFLAIATLKQLMTLDPNDVGAAMRLADAYIATGEPDKAVNLLRRLVTTCDTSDRRGCSIGLAVALYSNDSKAEAQKEFDSLVQAEPNDPAPLLAQVQLFEGDKLWGEIERKAVDWYQKHPEDIQTPLFVARRLAAVEDTASRKTAENILRMVLKDHPEDVETMSTLAMLMQLVERSDEAAKLYRRVLEVRPDDVVAMNNLAWILCEDQEKHQEAFELAQKGLKILPNYVDLIDTRGMVYYRMGEFDKAVQDFSTCIKLYPSETSVVTASHFHLGRAFAKLNQTDKAVESLNKALNLNSEAGGLSTADLADVKRLLEKLSKEGG